MAGDRAELDELRRLEELESRAKAPTAAAPYVPEGTIGPVSGPQGSAPNAGLVKFGSSVLGLPVDAIQAAINIPPEAARLGAMAVGRYDIAGKIPTLKNSVGGSQWIENMLRRTGVAGLNPDNPNPKDPIGTLQYDLMARGGFLPQGALPAIGSIAAEKALGPEYAGVGSMAPTAAKTAINAAVAPGRQLAQAQNVERDKTLRDAQAEGYKAIPTHVENNAAKAALESLGGKAAVKQQLTIDNAQTTTAIARREIGLPENAPLNVETLEARRAVLAEPYGRLAAISPNAQYFLREFRDSKQKATAYWQEYERQKTVNSLEQYKYFDNKADAAEKRLQLLAQRAGQPGLVAEMRQARQDIAKTWDVQRALNVGDGSVDAHALGRMLDNGAPLSGGLKTAAKFAQGIGKQVTGEASAQGTPNVSKVNFGVSPIFAGGGFALGGPLLAGVAGAAPFTVPPAARSIVTSNFYQNRFGQPYYGPPTTPENSLQALIRAGILNNQEGRQ